MSDTRKVSASVAMAMFMTGIMGGAVAAMFFDRWVVLASGVLGLIAVVADVVLTAVREGSHG